MESFTVPAQDMCADIFRNLPLGITIWQLMDDGDPTSLCLVNSNQAASDILGVDLRSKINSRITQCFPNTLQYDLDNLNHYAEIALTGQPSDRSIETYYQDDQVEGFYRVRVFPLPQRCVGCMFEDITSYKESEQALQDSERRYENLAKLLPVGIFRTNQAGDCIYVNNRWRRITGLPDEKSANEHWVLALHPDDRDRVVAEWCQAVAEQRLFRLEYRFLRPDGTVAWVLGQAVPQMNGRGQSIGYIGTITDISDRKQTELALRESEERFRATFEQAAVGIAHLSLDGRWLRVNQTLCDILGYDRATLMAMSYHDVTPAEYLERDRHILDMLLSGEVETFGFEKEYIRRDGSRLWVEITVSSVRGWHEIDQRTASTGATAHPTQSPEAPFAQGSDRLAMSPAIAPDDLLIGPVQYILAVIEDISERKQAEFSLHERANELAYLNAVLSRTTSLLKRRNEELDQFAYVASHDLKAPLRAIANLSEWIQEDLADKLPAENQRQMELLRGRVHRMEALINGLLEYSRVGRSSTDAEAVEVSLLLEEVIDLLAPPASFTIELPPQLPRLVTKRLLLRQVFANLIGNAIKHHHRSHGTIQVSVSDQGNLYQFAIADDGPGVDPKYHEKIFTIFQTLEARDVSESTGIGLAIVKKIVEAEGGAIWIESVFGQGSTFYFTWPKPNPC